MDTTDEKPAKRKRDTCGVIERIERRGQLLTAALVKVQRRAAGFNRLARLRGGK